MSRALKIALALLISLVVGISSGFLYRSVYSKTKIAAREESDQIEESSSSEGSSIQEEKTVPTPPPYQTFQPSLALEHIRQLSSVIGKRTAGTEGERRAAAYIKNVFTQSGYSQVVEESFPLENGLISQNIYVKSEGIDPQWTIIIGAHYDCLGWKGSPGANDNASGVGVMLELARVLRTNPHLPSLVFVAFGSEEILQGYGKGHDHYGSLFMAGRLRELGGKVVAMISIDMVGVGTSLWANATLAAPDTLSNLFISYARSLGVSVQFRQDPGWSDHESFENRGIPSLWLTYRTDPYYHTPGDSLDKISFNLIAQIGQVLQGFLEALDQRKCQTLDSATKYR